MKRSAGGNRHGCGADAAHQGAYAAGRDMGQDDGLASRIAAGMARSTPARPEELVVRRLFRLARPEPSRGSRSAPNVDWTGFVRLGYRVNPYLRLELEGGYRAARAGVRPTGSRATMAPTSARRAAPASAIAVSHKATSVAWTGMVNNGLVDLSRTGGSARSSAAASPGFVDMKTNIEEFSGRPRSSRPSRPWTSSSRSQSSSFPRTRESAGVSYHASEAISTSI